MLDAGILQFPQFILKIRVVSAPIRRIHMQKYIQIMINTIIVRLPYILDAASAMSRYMENAREKIDQARDEISAPGHWLLKLAFGSECIYTAPGTEPPARLS